MRKFITGLIIALISTTVSALSQPVTQPTTRRASYDVHSFFQPKRNLQMLHDMGIRVHLGPEVEGRSTKSIEAIAQAEAEWVAEVDRLRDKCVLKRPPATLPASCVGVLVPYDEPNGKGILPIYVKSEVDKLRTAYPGVKVWLSLAGDKITSANFGRPAELDSFMGYVTPIDVVTVNVYSMNRNAGRYLTTWTADCVKKVKQVAPSKRVIPWIEINDQQLRPPPPPYVNRAPTPEEIEQTLEAVLDAGADGFGWFSTCDTGKYGWGYAGDSYWPILDRNGVSIAPQLAKVRSLSIKYSPALPLPPPEDPVVTELKAENVALKVKNQSLEAKVDKIRAALEE